MKPCFVHCLQQHNVYLHPQVHNKFNIFMLLVWSTRLTKLYLRTHYINKILLSINNIIFFTGDSLQDDLNKLVAWSDKWLLKFNPEKCKIMLIGHTFQTEYEITDSGKTHLTVHTGRKRFGNIRHR